jgi:ribosomal protein S18 acetylase RimI-like enzyme
MNQNNFEIKEEIPSAGDFNNLRDLVGWGKIDEKLAENGLKNSLYSLCLYNGDKIIGICRLVGDGYLKVYIEELIIHPEYQKKGLGTMMMNKIMDYIGKNYKKGCNIGLFSNKGLEGFYNKFKFIRRKDDMPGMQYKL